MLPQSVVFRTGHPRTLESFARLSVRQRHLAGHDCFQSDQAAQLIAKLGDLALLAADLLGEQPRRVGVPARHVERLPGEAVDHLQGQPPISSPIACTTAPPGTIAPRRQVRITGSLWWRREGGGNSGSAFSGQLWASPRQAARSRVSGSIGRERVSHPSTFRITIWPEAKSTRTASAPSRRRAGPPGS